MIKREVRNSKGELVKLNSMESRIANYWEGHIKNALGFEIDVTTMTTIVKRVVEQKFFEIAPSEYMPIKVGNGAWSSSLTTYTSFSLADDFEKGNINLGGGNARLAGASAGVESLTQKIVNWAKTCDWTIFELEAASKSGNWDLVESVQKARKKNWDLGIQKVAFLGSATDANILGLLNQSTVNSNLGLITQTISSMTKTQLEAFLQGVIEAYRNNCARTAYPTHFLIPESDFNGLGVAADEGFPIKSKLQRMQEVFELATHKKDFKILPIAYGDSAYNSLGLDRYTLLNYDEDSLRMDIPVDYTATVANTLNGFQFQNVGYGQYTGVKAYRPLEMLYFDF